jgi:hypothetical protein
VLIELEELILGTEGGISKAVWEVASLFTAAWLWGDIKASEGSWLESDIFSVFLYTHSCFEVRQRVQELPGCPSHRTFKVAQDLL